MVSCEKLSDPTREDFMIDIDTRREGKLYMFRCENLSDPAREEYMIDIDSGGWVNDRWSAVRTNFRKNFAPANHDH